MTARCPKCKSDNVVKRGLSPTQNRGKQQRYLCKSCRKTFIQDLGFWKMKNSERIITMSIDMYLSNLSSRKMRNQLKRHFNFKISHVSILDWVRRYVLKVQRYVDSIKPNLSGKVYADETEVDCEGRKDVFWCAVDWDTRFINATLYSPKPQNVRDAFKFLSQVQDDNPYTITTDASPVYPRAIRKVFYSKEKKQVDVYHNVINHQKTKKYNVRIETVFSKIKDRVQDFRGFKALWSAPILMAGIVLQHNFIEKHSTTGKVPCELAGMNIDVKENRWLGLIRRCST